jgi:hypothetical protein
VTTPRGGWNRAAPAGAVRCDCPTRRERWAKLDPQAGQPCCHRPCCRAERAVITSTREQIARLREQLADAAWQCPRCGELVARHQRNFECLDAPTRAVRALRLAQRAGRRS